MTSETDGAACSGNQVRFSWCCWVVLWLFAFPLCAAATLDWWIPSIYRCHLQQCSECNGECNERFHMFYIFLGASQQSWKRVTRFSNKMVNDVVAHCPWQLLWSSLVIMSKEIRVSIRVAAAQQCVANLNVIVSFPTPEINFMSDKETHEHSFFIHFRLPFHLTSPAIAFLHPLSSHSWTKSSLRQVKSTIFTHISLPDTAPQSRVWVKREIKSIFLNISKPISSYSQIKLSNRARSRIFVQRFGVKSNTPFKAAVRTCIETPNRSYLLLAVSECGSWHDDCHPSSAHSASLKSSNRSETSPKITYRS